jgi:hypothetical protein
MQQYAASGRRCQDGLAGTRLWNFLAVTRERNQLKEGLPDENDKRTSKGED